MHLLVVSTGRVTVTGVSDTGDDYEITFFTASWIPLGKELSQRLAAMAADRSVRVRVLDADEQFALCESYHVISLPCAVVTRGDSVSRKFVGTDILDSVSWVEAARKRVRANATKNPRRSS